jgi:hypothetical protein
MITNELSPAYCDDEGTYNPPTWARKLHFLLGLYESPRSRTEKDDDAKHVCRLARVHLEQKYGLMATSPAVRTELAKWRIYHTIEETRDLHGVPCGDVAVDEEIVTLEQALERIEQLEAGIKYMQGEIARYRTFVEDVGQTPCSECGHPLDDNGRCSACGELIRAAEAA